MIKYILKFILVWTVAVFIYVVTASHVKAESWSMPNQAGGKIVITDRKCTNFTYLSESYTYAADGTVIKSCWAVIDGAIHIVYYNGKERIYPIQSFNPETSM